MFSELGINGRPRAVVTGATGGVGALVAADLAADYDVIALGRDEEKLADLAKLPGVEVVAFDLARRRPRLDLLPSLAGVEVLVHCAAVADPGPHDEVTAEEWRRQYEINVVAVAELTRLAIDSLRDLHGTVVFINSGSGLRASAATPVYAASKHALRAFADSLRLAEAANYVRVASIFPGPIDTPMQHVLRDGLGEPYLTERYLSPEIVARAVRFAIDAPPEAEVTEIHVRPRSESAPPPPGFDWSTLAATEPM